MFTRLGYLGLPEDPDHQGSRLGDAEHYYRSQYADLPPPVYPISNLVLLI